MRALKLLWDGLRASVGVSLKPTRWPSSWALFVLLLALHCAASAAYSWSWFDAPRRFSADGLQSEGLDALLALLLSVAITRLNGRPALGLAVANWWLALLLFAELWLAALREVASDWLEQSLGAHAEFAQALLFVVPLTLLAWRLLAVLAPIKPPKRWAGALLLGTFAIAPWFVLNAQWFWYTDYAITDEQAPPTFNPEALMFEQAARVGAAVDALKPERPGEPDLYVVSFGSDGAERVFRNEAHYVAELFAQRFGAQGRVLELVNHPDSTDRAPLATATNLAYALSLIGDIVDPQQDLLLVFLTSHGSEDRHLSVALEPLALNPLSADALATTLDALPIQHQVVIVSACYSGGFIPALKKPGRLVLTAARADRTSYGCGPDSDLTFFGRALFVDALNQTTSFVDAFEHARRAIAAREQAEGITPPSEPQLSSNADIEAALAAWAAQLMPGPALAFDAAAIARIDEGSARQ
jgi:hypothetical protein